MELYRRAAGKSSFSGDMIEVTGLDANVNMEPYASKAAQLSGVPFRFVLGDAEKLPFPDESFEAVVGTHVMCSVPQPERALREIARVLKPGGRYLFWEHVRAQDDRKGLQFQQDILDPLQQVFFQGCHLSRDTLGTIMKSEAFSDVQAETKYLGDRPLLSPHAIGIAYK